MNWLYKLNRNVRLSLLSVVLGIVGALGAQVFLWMLHLADAYLLQGIGRYAPLSAEAASQLTQVPTQPWLWWIPVATTVGGLISGLLVYTFAPEAEGHGTDAAVSAYHRHGGKSRPRVLVVKSIASAITIGSGGSAGREGPVAQIAASMGSIFGGLFKLSDDERRYLVLIGMAAGLSAIFKSPLGTAIFAVEILYSGMVFEAEALTFTLIGSAVAYAFNGLFQGWTPLFKLTGMFGLTTLDSLIWYALLGVAAGLVGVLLPAVFYHMRDAFTRIPVPRHIKPAIGGLLLGVIGLFVPALLGGGYGFIEFALEGAGGMAVGYMLLLALGKIVALSLTVSSGGSGGVFGPSLYVGALLGAAIAALLTHAGISNVETTGMVVVGMAAVFAGTARVPIASMIMVVEMTGAYNIIMPAMITVAISYLVQSGVARHRKYPGLYEAQLPAPQHSPVHYQTYYRAVADLMRQRKLHLESDVFYSEFQHALDEGETIPLHIGQGDESLYTLRLPERSRLHDAEIRSLGLEDVLITSIVRGDDQIVPTGGARLRAGDYLVLAGRPKARARFEAMAREQIYTPATEDAFSEDGAKMTTPDDDWSHLTHGEGR